MRLDRKDDPTKDEFSEMVTRFYDQRAKDCRMFSFVLVEINFAFQVINFSKIENNQT